MYRVYDSATERWISRDPIGEAGGENLYSYVTGDPVRKLDPYGLSNRDVLNIVNTAQKAIDAMTDSGERVGNGAIGGDLNDILTSFVALDGLIFGFPERMKGCGEQAEAVKDKLLALEFDDTWTIAQTYVNEPAWHQFLILHSDNPSGPTIIIDPWENKISIENFPTILWSYPHDPDIFIKPPGDSIPITYFGVSQEKWESIHNK